MARKFKYALEYYSSQEGAPVTVDGDFQQITHDVRTKFQELAADVRLDCGESAASIITDWKRFFFLICKLEHRTPDQLISSTWSADHGGDYLKLSGSFRFAPEEEEKALPLSFSRTGVRKLFCFALVSDVKETYQVMKALLSKLHLNNFKLLLESFGAEVFMVNDLKMCWTCAGMSHGGRHSCPFCYWRSTDGFGVQSDVRTCQRDTSEYHRWRSETKHLSFKRAKDRIKFYNNCLRPTLIRNLCQNKSVIDFLWPPPLHLKLRNANKLLSDLCRCAPSVHKSWLGSVGIATEKYHGELEGNPITKLLGSTDVLRACITADIAETFAQNEFFFETRLDMPPDRYERDLLQSREELHAARHYPDTFAALAVLIARMSQKKLHSDLQAAADAYCDALHTLGCSKTVAMHVIIDEVPRLCRRRNRGLGYHTEQAAESLHSEIARFATRWRVPLPSHAGHAEGVKRMMCGMNTEHAVLPAF